MKMSAAQAQQEKKATINEKLNDFIQKNRVKLIAGLSAILIILAGIVIFTTVREKIQTGALAKVDAFTQRYYDLRMYISEDDHDDDSKQADINALLEDLSEFAAKNSGFAAARAYSISAEIYAGQKKWEDAEKAWLASADKAAKAYLAPVSVFNAAVAAEEQGNSQQAIDLYARALNYGDNFPAAARAQFSVGRLEEGRNNRSAALEAYRSLVSKWPNDPVWTNLAQSRIVVLAD